MADIMDKVPKSPKQVKEDQDASVRNSLGRIKNKFIVMSGKGGVGKTSTAVNLSIALARQGFQVGIMDVDLHGPDVPRMLGLEGMPDLNSNRKLTPLSYSDRLGVISMESFLPQRDDAIIWRGPLKFSAIRQFIADVEWGELDILLVDLPPGTGDAQLSLCQTVPLDGGVIVTTPQEASLGVVRKGIAMFQKVNVPILGIVENMSYYTTPSGDRVEIFGHGGGAAEALLLAPADAPGRFRALLRMGGRTRVGQKLRFAAGALAREAEICYATLAMVTDYDCWHPDHEAVTAEQIIGVLGRNAETARRVLRAAVRRLPIPRGCECATALKYALVTASELVPEETRRELEPIVGRYLK